ncbi:hypothetical protein FS837_006050, partial [Tulasnella sp. UAMH 9824]
TLLGGLIIFPALINAFANPIKWEDLPDADIRRVGAAFYYSASTGHYFPGAFILRTYDFQNWAYVGHSVPTLDFGSSCSLTGGQAYGKGIRASFFGYHTTKTTWYWGGCIDSAKSYIYSASDASGPWSRLTAINKCYYDCGLLIDDDGTMYVSYVYNNNIWVAQLASDAKSEIKSQEVYVPPSNIGTLKGTRFFKRNGLYYILATDPATSEYILKAGSVFGTYTIKTLASNLAPPIQGAGSPHRGAIVDSTSWTAGEWYYIALVDAYPGGRIPVIAPITWDSDDFPTLTLVNGTWGDAYSSKLGIWDLPYPVLTDYFTSIGPIWEWNHNPDTSKFSAGSSGLTLYTATVTNDLYTARNTITAASLATFNLYNEHELRVPAGYRWGIFNYATTTLGGYVTVPVFSLNSGPITKPSSVTTTTPQTTTMTTTSTRNVSTTRDIFSTTTTAGGGCTVVKWGQCGGIGFTGCKSCATGTTCTYSND